MKESPSALMFRRHFLTSAHMHVPVHPPARATRPAPLLLMTRKLITRKLPAVADVPPRRAAKPASIAKEDATVEFSRVIEAELIPLATTMTKQAGVPPTAAFHAAYRKKTRNNDGNSNFVVETTPCSIRIRARAGLNNIGISWSDARRVYIGGIKTNDTTAPFPRSALAIPLFRSFIHSLGITAVGLFDGAGVSCPCGVTVPQISIVRVLAGESLLYERIPGLRFKASADDVEAAKHTLRSNASSDELEACTLFLKAHRSGDVHGCVHARVNIATRKAVAFLKNANTLFESIISAT